MVGAEGSPAFSGWFKFCCWCWAFNGSSAADPSVAVAHWLVNPLQWLLLRLLGLQWLVLLLRLLNLQWLVLVYQPSVAGAVAQAADPSVAGAVAHWLVNPLQWLLLRLLCLQWLVLLLRLLNLQWLVLVNQPSLVVAQADGPSVVGDTYST